MAGHGAGLSLVAAFLAAFPLRSPVVAGGAQGAASDAASDPAARGVLRTVLRQRGGLLAGAMLAVHVGLEVSVGNWGFSYLVQARGLTASLAGYTVSGYWLGLTLDRFLIGPIAAKLVVPTAAMMYGCLAGVAAAATLAWLSPTAAVTITALVLLGFFLGPVWQRPRSAS